ncbi:hypothetical protein V6N13_052256 [Hibiscus sabdariffa]|uniref:Uncharacterized protein n=1 Tax=Hibiscus sabdariffa TaxID=183260 RepID=A0ABR1ZUC1_9ROSI
MVVPGGGMCEWCSRAWEGLCAAVAACCLRAQAHCHYYLLTSAQVLSSLLSFVVPLRLINHILAVVGMCSSCYVMILDLHINFWETMSFSFVEGSYIEYIGTSTRVHTHEKHVLNSRRVQSLIELYIYKLDFRGPELEVAKQNMKGPGSL